MNPIDHAIRDLLVHYPNTQAVYLFGSYGTADEWPTSDVDIAVLLPPVEAKQAGQLVLSPARVALEAVFNRDVDLVNLRLGSTVFQKEVVMTGRRIYCADTDAADTFEMFVMSQYQKLNDERAEILAEGLKRGRFYDV